MKKKSVILLLVILALVLSGSLCAYAFVTANETMGITEPTGDVAVVSVAPNQPNWNQIISQQQTTQTLRPDSAGAQTNLSQFPAAGNQWDKVDEASADGDATYVYSTASGYQEDTYNIANPLRFGSILRVNVYMVVRSTVAPPRATAYVHISTGGNLYNGPELTVTTGYAVYSYQWNQNPATGQAWTWSDIDSLQIGAGLRRPSTGEATYLTQVYAEVLAQGIVEQSNVPTGNLFYVAAPPSYSGGLAVRLYLVNTGNLTKAYEYMNLQVFLTDSTEAGQTPNYRLLTLKNGVASFTLPQPAAGDHTMSIIGGSYGLLSGDTGAWSPGWSVTPQFYCEAVQR